MTSTSGIASANPAQYTGRENDGTGLYYYRSRYYDPRLQRFLSEDSFGLDGGDVNLHAYVGNNPTGYRDPSGHFAILILPLAGCLGGAAGAALGNEMTGRKTTLRDLAGGCAAGAMLGLGGWAIGPAIAPGAFGAGVGAATGATFGAVAAGVREAIALRPGQGTDGALTYTRHAIMDRMIPNGITPELVREAIPNGASSAGNVAGRTVSELSAGASSTGVGVKVVMEGNTVVT